MVTFTGSRLLNDLGAAVINSGVDACRTYWNFFVARLELYTVSFLFIKTLNRGISKKNWGVLANTLFISK